MKMPSHPTRLIRFIRPSAGRSLAAFCGLGLAVSSSSQAGLLVYEPFNYLTGTPSGNGVKLNGQGGSTEVGFAPASTWTAANFGGPGGGIPDSITVYAEGAESGLVANDNVTANPFDGTYANLPHSGGYFGSVNTSVNATDHLIVWRPLAPSVTASFADGTSTWFSYVNARSYSNNARCPSFALASASLGEDRGNNGFGEGIGVGGRNNAGTVIFPQYFDQTVSSPGEAEAALNTPSYGGGPFTQQSYAGGDAAVPAGEFFTWNSAGANYGRAQIIVGRIDWKANGTPDVITVARFNDDEEVTEDAFNAIAISSANFTGPQPDLDQSQFDTLTIAGGRFFADEIRIATTFAEAVGQGAVPFKLWIARNDPNLDFAWESQAGKLYRLRSSADLSTDFATWTLVAEDLPPTAPMGSTSIPKPLDPTLFYRIEEYPAPPVTVYSENFDSTTAGMLPADWSSGQNDPFTTSPTLWELGSPSVVGPTAAYSGANCVGTDLDADYADLDPSGTGVGYTDIWLRTNSINLSSHPKATLTFQQFKDIENTFDYASIRILDASDDSELAVLENQTVSGSTSGAWAAYSKALPAAAFTVPIKLEFRFEADDTNESVPFAGWYIDDLAITTPAP